MEDKRNCRSGAAITVIALVITVLVTGCVNEPPNGTSLASNSSDSPIPPKSAAIGIPVPPLPSKPNYIVVERGRSLNGIAYSHHVSPAGLAAANHLTPPYKLKIGSRLLIPSPGAPPVQQANASNTPPPTALPPPASTPSAQQEQKNGREPPTAIVTVPPSVASVLMDLRRKRRLPSEKQALAHAPAEADPVIPPRNPAAALPLPDEADFQPRLSPLVR